jgi:hypothetical protein
MNARRAAIGVACTTLLAGCVTTLMQGYARPARPVEHIAVVAPPPALVASLASESGIHGLVIEDGNAIVPPIRPYKDAKIRQLLSARGIDGVLAVNVSSDTGVQERYAGTIFSGNYSSTSVDSTMVVGNTIFRFRDLLRHDERYGDTRVSLQPDCHLPGASVRSEVRA